MSIGLWLHLDFIQPGGAGKGLVGLIHHGYAAVLRHDGDDAPHAGSIPLRARGVVGVGQKDQLGAVLGNGLQHGRFVQLKVLLQRHAHKLQPQQLGGELVHHKAGLGRQNGGGLGMARAFLCLLQQQRRCGFQHRQGQQGNEFVRAIAQNHLVTGWCLVVHGQRLLERFCFSAGVAVDGQLRQTLPQRCLQLGRKRVGVFHRVEFDQARRLGDGVSAHGPYIWADAGGKGGIAAGHGKKKQSEKKPKDYGMQPRCIWGIQPLGAW